MSKNRIGIFAGSFDPVHIGHITFALQSIKEAKLDCVYFLPERAPRSKLMHEHFGHRVAMIKRALRPHSKLKMLELTDKTFSISRTMPKLQKTWPDHELVFLFGSDKIADMSNWPDSGKLLKNCEVVVGLRQGASRDQINELTKLWPKQPVSVIASYWPAVLSTEIRRSLYRGESANGLLKSVSSYIRQNWLYISLRDNS